MKALGVLALLLMAACGQRMSAGEVGPQGWQTLFDGQSLSGWEPRGDAVWIVENGYITTVPGTGDGFLATVGDYADYRIQVDFWADETANGGIYLRVPAAGPGVNPSIEVNISDSHRQWPTGSIAGVTRHDGANTVGRWSSFDITIRGDHVTVLLDGRLVAEGEASRAPSGRIALQKLGEGVVRHRNIRVSPL